MKKSCIKIKEIKNIRTLINDIKSGQVGWYGYQGKTILVGYRKGRDEEGRDSKQRTYWDRRKKGLCVKCGKKVSKKNPQTGKLYRLCDRHRKELDQKKI